METLGINLIRTYVPLAVGLAISWLVAHGVHIDTQAKFAVSGAMTTVISGAYYTVVRVLEERWPAIGVLLGARRPVAQGAEEWPPGPDETQPWPPPAEQPAGYATPVAPATPDSCEGTYAYPMPRNMSVTSTTAAPVPPPVVAASLAELVAQTAPTPLKRRGPATGAMPTYERPPGR